MAPKDKAPKKGRHTAPKAVLKLPDLDQAKSAVLSSLSSPDAQRGYKHAIDEFVEWYCSEPRLSFSRTVVLRYRMHLESRNLASGTINLRLGAVRRLAYEAADCGLLSQDLAAGIRRVKGVKKLGVRLGNWLTAEQASTLWQTPPEGTLKGKRDQSTAGGAVGLRLASPRGSVAGDAPHSAAGGTLGDHRPARQGWPHPDCSDSVLGEGGVGSMDRRCKHHERQSVSPSQ